MQYNVVSRQLELALRKGIMGNWLISIKKKKKVESCTCDRITPCSCTGWRFKCLERTYTEKHLRVLWTFNSLESELNVSHQCVPVVNTILSCVSGSVANGLRKTIIHLCWVPVRAHPENCAQFKVPCSKKGLNKLESTMVAIGLMHIMWEEIKRVGFGHPEEERTEEESNCFLQVHDSFRKDRLFLHGDRERIRC